MLLKQARTICWKMWAVRHEYDELEEGVFKAMLRRKTISECTDKHRNVIRKLVRKRSNVKDITKKEGTRSTYCVTARVGKKSEVRSQRNCGNGSKEQEHQRNIGMERLQKRQNRQKAKAGKERWREKER